MRKKLIVSSNLQHRYLRVLLLSLLLPTFICGIALYYLIFTLLAQEVAIPEFIAQTLLPAIKKINIMIMISIPIVFLVLSIMGLIISHRLAGPVERLKKELGEIVNGDYSKRIRLREKDELKPVADNINKLLDRIGGKD